MVGESDLKAHLALDGSIVAQLEREREKGGGGEGGGEIGLFIQIKLQWLGLVPISP